MIFWYAPAKWSILSFVINLLPKNDYSKKQLFMSTNNSTTVQSIFTRIVVYTRHVCGCDFKHLWSSIEPQVCNWWSIFISIIPKQWKKYNGRRYDIMCSSWLKFNASHGQINIPKKQWSNSKYRAVDIHLSRGSCSLFWNKDFGMMKRIWHYLQHNGWSKKLLTL